MRMLLAAGLVAGLLPSTIVLSALYAQTSGDRHIVPGKSVGAIALGMSYAEVARILGEPQGSERWDRPFPLRLYLWTGLIVDFDASDTVVCIHARRAFYSTTGGLTIGYSEPAVRTVMGPPSRYIDEAAVEHQPADAGRIDLFYDAKGIAFELVNWKVDMILVYTPSRYGPLQTLSLWGRPARCSGIDKPS